MPIELSARRPKMVVSNLPVRFIGGPGGAPAVEYVQGGAAATWIITHNLGRIPYVDIYVDGELVETDVESTINVTTATFPIPYAGSAAIF